MNTTRETLIAEVALEGILILAQRSSNDNPFGQARLLLGDSFPEALTDAVRRNTARALADEFNRDAILHALPGLPVGQMVMADIIAGTLNDIVAAAKEDDSISPNPQTKD